MIEWRGELGDEENGGCGGEGCIIGELNPITVIFVYLYCYQHNPINSLQLYKQEFYRRHQSSSPSLSEISIPSLPYFLPFPSPLFPHLSLFQQNPDLSHSHTQHNDRHQHCEFLRESFVQAGGIGAELFLTTDDRSVPRIQPRLGPNDRECLGGFCKIGSMKRRQS